MDQLERRRQRAKEMAWLHDPKEAVARRIELLTLVRDQHTMAQTAPPACACCGYNEARWPQLFKCFHCDLWFCPACSRNHFGPGPRGDTTNVE